MYAIAPLLLCAIILTVMFFILTLILQNEFDENDFDAHTRVLAEYMRRTNAETNLPDTLGYVSHVDGYHYMVTYFNTLNAQKIKQTIHDDRKETFDFIAQSFNDVNMADDEARIRPKVGDKHAFQIRGDDGWLDIQCPDNEMFDSNSMQCVTIPYCYEKLPGNYGITEPMLNALVLNHNVRNENFDDNLFHPTMYLKCFEGQSYTVEECPSNHTFNVVTQKCELINRCQNRPDDFILDIFPEDLNINEYMICENGETKIVSCGENKIFDQRLMQCVTSSPCEFNGIGFTYITDEINANQFYRCVSRQQAELITCINRTYNNNQYECSGDSRCTIFENGTGTNLNVFENDVIKYNAGILICDNFEIITDVQCDTQNLVVDKIYNNRFMININVPNQVFDVNTVQCVPFNKELVQIKNNYYSIENVDNDYNVNFQTAMIGETEHVDLLTKTSDLSSLVAFAKDKNAVGLNPENGVPIHCFGNHLYDMFSGNILNVCDDSNNLIETFDLSLNHYYRPKTLELGVDGEYRRFCGEKIENSQNIVKNDLFRTRILTNILRSDVCGLILAQMHHKYTTIDTKYTPIYVQYTYEREKVPKNIVVYPSNITEKNATIVKKRSSANDNFAQTVRPIFDNFDYIPVAQPLFDPFVKLDENIDTNSDLKLLLANEKKLDAANLKSDSHLLLDEKFLEYSCFYSLPTFKCSECKIDNDIVVDKLEELRSAIDVEIGCETASGLANIINAYAYMGNGYGCRSVYDQIEGVIKVLKTDDGPQYANVDTQSNDGHIYNPWLHRTDDKNIFACPPDLVNENNNCDLDSNVFYYLEDLH
ncbi:capsid associated protein VP91 [Adoxophyes honmai nucleopolyhedrovirus]|uniref:Capsid associated protein VP91 n=1 Tax=Adoxophyes honmai nucleopolyhedrovirus TaxID=224399 RepID=Q80LN0_NPVAH|nr:capsid associated protein VP91 [Adoxophyes honmai nucleopolyhedrovirus]BAC67317.1 capsid associated protein VP91 [Adoxophyes honmai nucleopolyhedrovirus]